MDTQTQASAYSLDHVTNSELHLTTRRLVGRSNQILAALLASYASSVRANPP
jgi:hypothetical protein